MVKGSAPAPDTRQQPLAFWKHVVAGGTAGVAEISVMYPTDVAKTRAQLSKTPVTMVQTLQSVVAEQGMRGLYRGVVTPIMAEAPKRAWKFSANEGFKKQVANFCPGGKLTVPATALAGALAGMSEALINCPFETVKVRMQAKENLARFKNSTECFTALLKEEGVRGLYSGIGPQMWRNALWNGMYFGVIGLASIKFPLPAGSSKEQQLGYKFCTGSLGSCVGTLCNTPFDVVKSRMQLQVPVPGEGLKYRNSLQAISVVAREEGTAALYKGLGPRLVRLGPGGGIMIVAFDFVSNLLRDL